MSLQELIITDSPKLELVGVATASVIELPAPNLVNLEIRSCKSAKLPLEDGKGLPSTLTSFSIGLFDKITTNWTLKEFPKIFLSE